MSMTSRLLTIGAAGALLVAGFIGFSAMNKDVTAQDGDMVVLHRGNGAEPSSLDPHKAAGTWENNIIGDLMLGLYTDDPQGEPILGAAEDHQISEDGLTHTFTIREGLVWSDGVPVTAGDFVFAFRRIMNPLTAARYASLLYPIENAQEINSGQNPNLEDLGVRAINDRTLEIRLNRPAAFLPALLTHYTTFALPQHVIDEYGDSWTRPENMVTNGAYSLVAWSPNDFIRVRKNPLFYDADNVAIDEIVFYPTDDSTAALRRFRAGELDMNAGFPSQQFEWLQANMPDETHVAAYIGTNYLAINLREEVNGRPNPLLDLRVRQALALAIDRQIIAEQILRTGQIPAFTLVPPEMPNYTPPVSPMQDMTQEERNEEARRLMRQAGYGPDNQLHIQYRYRESVDNRRAAVAMAGFWQAIYADVNIINTEPAIHYRDMEQGNFEIGDAGWIADYPDPENYLFLLDSSSGLLNYGEYANPEFDALLAQAASMTDLEARSQVLTEAEAILVRELPLIPTTFSVSNALVGPHVQGYEDNLVNIHRTRFMSIDENLRPQQEGVVDQIMRWFN